ncbi:MAG: hypothetical protein AB1752_04305 [Candidatus Zixiibacteriota bacterium]
MNTRNLAALATVLAVTAGTGLTAVPPLINYQAVLSDDSGVPLPDGNYSVTFRIWDDESGGSAVWQEGRLITVQRGLFNVLLGAVVPIPDSVFASPDRWLGLQVGLNAETAPRTRLVSIPYAWESKHSERADTATASLDKTIDAGDLVIGTLDTLRFSAYEDLLSEGRIGDSEGQLPPSTHSHPGLDNTFREVDDTSFVYLLPPGQMTVLKSVVLPAGEVGDYFKVTFPVACIQAEGDWIEYFLGLNGTNLKLCDVLNPGQAVCAIECVRWASTVWRCGVASFVDDGSSGPFQADHFEFTLDTSSPITVSVLGRNLAGGYGAEVGTITVSYDKD